MRWKESKDDTLDIAWPKIQKELETIRTVEDVQVAGFDQVLFIVDGVKISFYAAPRKRIPSMQEIPYMNNIRLADIESIGIMKMEAMTDVRISDKSKGKGLIFVTRKREEG